MLDHLIVRGPDLARSRRFYEQGREPLGLRSVLEFPMASLSVTTVPSWLYCGNFSVQRSAEGLLCPRPGGGGRLPSRRSGRRPPGLRPEYHPDYFAAFVIDPDGNNIEAVCHVSSADSSR